ncbi:hypothetical protein AMAG_13727 [Allomyces macrogynus ATCC 38327]|uniref:Uncharacterized protein n=1 Tax=Allomyces macrogynus (strain ATCC 38327) TaxID=578462 RepID=A0A0L0T3S7_ALLM3|nr:hypothetical protein AMAG_13727 [Allomyces macrogynus ATCC 38327]|eukprot:KNE69360.1 hypothetical protein AMAG_13727 [Allomyces macrogynus ATCC 38327]
MWLVLSALVSKFPPCLQHLMLMGPMAGDELGMLVAALPKTLMSLQLKCPALLSCFSMLTKALMQLIDAIKDLNQLKTLVFGHPLHATQWDKVWADLVLTLPVLVQ